MFLNIFGSVLVPKENKTKCKEKRRFLKELHVQVWVVQGYQPIHNKILAIDLMPEQRHSNLSKIGAVVSKKTSQCLNML